jgi:hypothetical protein
MWQSDVRGRTLSSSGGGRHDRRWTALNPEMAWSSKTWTAPAPLQALIRRGAGRTLPH